MTTQTERRKTQRRPVLESFSLFVVLPKMGAHRLPVHDISEGGMLFDLDEAGELIADKPVAVGESLKVHLYLNQTLYVPLQVKIARIEPVGEVRRVGTEMLQKNSAAYRAYLAFVQMLDGLMEEGRVAQ